MKNLIKMEKRKLELLAPAANAEVAIQAVLHGADAIYMGASSHGARKDAANSIDDIARVVDFAHRYRVKVYVTVNTLVYEKEIEQVAKLCHDLYRVGVDALIVQDMALLHMDLPPIPLHASTQCDIRTPEKAKFLQDVGFSQLVLARELTIDEIAAIADNVDIPVECFIHGALCVSYSGRCHASYVSLGRSANRGECAQICRLPYTLKDADGEIVVKDRHLLSLHDFNASLKLADLIEAGVSSFKIEGRLKDADYVKNVVAYYRMLLDDFIDANSDRFEKSSYGRIKLSFIPNLYKSFNRGFTDYFLSSRRPEGIASLMTPKSMGEPVSDMSLLNNGDGISFFDRDGNYQGVNINKVENGKIFTARNVGIPKNAEIHRTYDVEWHKAMSRETAVRKLSLKVILDDNGVTAEDERGVKVRLPIDCAKEVAHKKADYRGEFSKLGNTHYILDVYDASHDEYMFIPRSKVSELRRNLVALLDCANLSTYCYDKRRKSDSNAVYPHEALDFKDNVANSLSEKFYRLHGVREIEPALEAKMKSSPDGLVVMTTRHCILRELGMCRKEGKLHFKEPLSLANERIGYSLKFNCSRCEMEVIACSPALAERNPLSRKRHYRQ